MRFHLEQEEKINAIEFFFAPLSGKFEVMFSREIEYPSDEKLDQRLDLAWNHSFKIAPNTKNPFLKGYYYFAIRAINSGIITVTPVLESSDFTVVSLHEGLPLKYSFSKDDNKLHYFTF